MELFKKIYHGLNLMGNRIINAKVDLPTDPKHIASKEYSDSQQIYDTPAANQITQSPKFSWIGAIKGKTWREIIDLLVYPNVKPDYFNPVLKVEEFTCNGQYETIIQKYLVFNYTNLSVKVKYATDNFAEREGLSACVLAVQNGASLATFTATDLSGAGTIEATFEVKPDTRIFLRRHFGPAPNIKLDTYGNPSIPDEFKIGYDAEAEITDLVFGQICTRYNPVYSKPISISELPLHQANDVKTAEEILAMGYVKYLDHTFTANADAIYSFLIPEQLFDQFMLSNILYKGDLISKTNRVEILKEWLTNETNGEKQPITIDAQPYVICSFDFGYFTEQMNSRLYFTKIM